MRKSAHLQRLQRLWPLLRSAVSDLGDLATLIAFLAPGASIPSTREGRWKVFRALVNLRDPEPASAAFLKIQDRFLRSEIAAKGVTRIHELTPVQDRLYLWQGDITALGVDGIVNAANNALLGCFHPGHDCIDNIIHTYAGVQLRQACAAIMSKQGHPEPVGGAKITPGFNLPARYVLHTVGPMISGPLTKEDQEQLASCYRSCLGLAEASGLKSLALCCISTGVFRFPPREAARIAVAEAKRHVADGGRLEAVVFNVFRDEDLEIYRSLLG